MNRFTLLILTAALLATAAFLISCGEDSTVAPAADTTTDAVATVYPPDGAVGVPTSGTISLVFDSAMDTMSVMSNFHFAGGPQMGMWMDSLDMYGGFGMMNMMQTGHMMTWLDSIDMDGSFVWNNSLDSCEFIPDSTLMPNTEYYCVVYDGGMQMMGGGMMGGNHGDAGYHIYRFMTGSQAPATAPDPAGRQTRHR